MAVLDAASLLPESRIVSESAQSEVDAAVSARAQREDAWKPHIDRLLDWYNDPEQAVDECQEPPSRTSVLTALGVARDGEDSGAPPPTLIVADGQGGVSFELCRASLLQLVNVRADGSIQFEEYENDRQRFATEYESGSFRLEPDQPIL